MYRRIWQEILKHQNILLHLHPNPDPDSFASTLTLFQVLQGLKKSVTLISGDSVSFPGLLKLPGAQNITKSNFFDINLRNYDLFIIADSSSRNQISKLGQVTFPPHLFTVCIDHHTGNNVDANLSIIRPNISSTSEIVYNLLRVNHVPITRDMAACLMVGIYDDTGGFKYDLVTHRTFRAAAYLSKICPDYFRYIFEFENNNTLARLKLSALLLSNLHEYFSGKVLVAQVSKSQIKKNKISPETFSNLDISNNLKSVSGKVIGASLIEGPDGLTKISLRTRDSNLYNVGAIARQTGFGGGHAAAAGSNPPLSLKKSLLLLLNSIKALYPNLGEP